MVIDIVNKPIKLEEEVAKYDSEMMISLVGGKN
jgi:hypothetical protein